MYFSLFYNVSIADLEQVNVSWDSLVSVGTLSICLNVLNPLSASVALI